jgi:hypothetical protein
VSTKAGRNDPCPCGSGKKYKICCLDANRAESLGFRRLRRIEAELIPDLFRFSDEVYGEAYFLEAWEEFSLWRPLAEDVADVPEFSTTFPHWFLFRFEFDPNQPRDVEVDWPSVPVALAYLERHGDRLDSAKRNFIENLCRRPYSFYRILHVDAGRSLVLRDVFTGAEYDVTDNQASKEARVGGLFYTSVLPVDETAILVGCAPSLLPPYEELRLLDLRDRIEGGSQDRRLNEDDLCDCDIEVRSRYWDAIYGDEELDGLELDDFDGEPVVFTCLYFELSCSPGEAFEKLRTLALDVREEDLLARASYSEKGELEMVSLPWLERRELSSEVEPEAETDDREGDDGRGFGIAYLGYITIDGSELMAEVTSCERADRLRAEIENCLGAVASFQRSEVEPFEEYLEDLSLWMEDDDEEEEEGEEGEDLSTLGEEPFEEAESDWFESEEEEVWAGEIEDDLSDDGWPEQGEGAWDEVDWSDEDQCRTEAPEEGLPAAASPEEPDESSALDEEEQDREQRPDSSPARRRTRVFDASDLFPRASVPDASELRSDASAVTSGAAERFWQRWLDQKIPALHDRTPREAVATPKGCERVEVLLRSYEWAFEVEPEVAMAIDVASLRRELGLL